MAYEKSASKPENATQERKRNSGLPALTGPLVRDVTPSPDTATAHGSDEVDEKTEGSHPSGEEDKIDGPVDEPASKGDEPDEGEEQGDTGDDLGVDEALLGPGVGLVEGMEVLAYDASDHLHIRQLGIHQALPKTVTPAKRPKLGALALHQSAEPRRVWARGRNS